MSEMRVAIVVAVLVVACGGDDDTPGAADASPDAPAAFDTCEGACATSSLTATFGATMRTFDLAYFGNNSNGTLYVEAYVGATPGCPEATTPVPDATITIPSLDKPAGIGSVADFGVNLLDFEGALLPSAPTAQSTGSSLSWVASDGAMFIAFDLDATFDTGMIAGHVYATLCNSLSEL